MHSSKQTKSAQLTPAKMLKKADECMLDPKRHNEALTLYTKVLTLIQKKSDPDSQSKKSTCLMRIAEIHDTGGDLPNACKTLETYNEEFPNQSEGLFRLVGYYIQLNEEEKAYKYFNRGIDKFTPHELTELHMVLLSHMLTTRSYCKIVPTPEKHLEVLNFVLQQGRSRGQYYYDKFLIFQYLKNEEHDLAFTLALKYCKSNNIALRQESLYQCGFAMHHKKKAKMAIGFYEKSIALYEQQKLLLNDDSKKMMAQVAHSIAKIYSGDCGSSFIDSNLEVKYLLIAAEHGIAESHHDLGYIHEHGEIGEIDPDKAIKYYTRALELGHEISTLNLGMVYHLRDQPGDNEIGVTYFEKAKQIPELKLKAYGNLGVYYFRLAIKQHNENQLEQAALNAQLAINNLQTAYAMGCSPATRNLGVLYSMNQLGVSPDYPKAIAYFEEAREAGMEIETDEIIPLYYRLFEKETDAEKRKKLIKDLDEKYSCNSVELLKEINSIRHEISVSLNKSIIKDANDPSLDIMTRITRLLEYDVAEMNTVNVCTVLHRLGNLTEKILHQRDFLQNNLKCIIPLLENAYTRLCEGRIAVTYYVNLIEGVSKLALMCEIEIYKKLLEMLYQKSCEQIDGLLPQYICLMVSAATRLDPNLNIKNELKTLIKKVIQLDKPPTGQSLTVFFNAIIVLSIPSGFGLTTSNYRPLVKLASSELSPSMFFIHRSQLCAALQYCYQNKIFRNEIDKEKLDAISKSLAKDNNLPTSSRLGKNVIYQLAVYYKNIAIEENIGPFSVDALVEIDDKQKVILQIDGPPHFLYGHSDMKVNVRTKFRDAYLSAYYPVITVSYKEWNPLKTSAAIKRFFTQKLANISIELPQLNQKKTGIGINGFFMRPQVPQTPARITTTPRLV